MELETAFNRKVCSTVPESVRVYLQVFKIVPVIGKMFALRRSGFSTDHVTWQWACPQKRSLKTLLIVFLGFGPRTLKALSNFRLLVFIKKTLNDDI